MKQLFVDVETTGLNSEKNSIVHLACIVVLDGKVKEKFSLRMSPGYNEVVNVNKFYNSGKKTVISQETGFKRFIAFLDTYINKYNTLDKFTFAAHNAAFDSGFIREWFRKNDNNFYGSYFYTPVLCTMALTHLVLSGQAKTHLITSYKLKDILTFYNIKANEEKLHDATYDIKLTYELYKALTNDFQIKQTKAESAIQKRLSGVREGSRSNKKRV
jgi:DNA polymerase III subunit epsilon